MARRPLHIAEDELRQIARTGDPVSDLHRMITGHAVRLHIPLKDPVQVREVAKALRVLASAIEMEARRSDVPAWQILSAIRNSIMMCNRVIGGRRSR